MDQIDSIIEASRDHRGAIMAQHLKQTWERIVRAIVAPDEPVERRGRDRGALDVG